MSISDELTSLPPVSSDAVEAFRSHLPKLVDFTNDKFALDRRFACGHSCCRKPELAAEFNKTFGEILLGIYTFSLYECLAQEFGRHAAALDARGLHRDFTEAFLKAWIMGLQALIKRPESSQLAAPLERLSAHLESFYQEAPEQEPRLDERAVRFLSYLLQHNRKFAAETLLSLMREGATVEDVYNDVLTPALMHVSSLWRRNEISTADYNTANDICRYVMFRIMDSIFGERRYPFKVLVCCLPGEAEVLGGEIFANYLEIKGWAVSFIRQPQSRDDILYSVTKNQPQAVVCSVASIARLPDAGALIEQIRSAAPSVYIFMEGPAAILARERLVPGADGVVSGLEEGHREMLDQVMPHA